ncbi:hypothetical protein PAXRUDRAFT_637422 [Paxillus rubicundulus Ve08.2h10]|uniref:Uncharacterized protein n=1 Tax=Paxillus rubicundulus Ve08.2h10 TaxID=930991 RepID=A0A0D0EC60_9AGAM|nr:hypothetical protein PAXRUDRAFT_637422 [Paxillus rubicundulus Ve08.2h10]
MLSQKLPPACNQLPFSGFTFSAACRSSGSISNYPSTSRGWDTTSLRHVPLVATVNG